MRAWVAQATVRALFLDGCGDPRLLTAFHDLGDIGLPHPDPLNEVIVTPNQRYKEIRAMGTSLSDVECEHAR